MKIIFNEDALSDIEPPCVAMSFVNHRAVLYKLFVVGEEYRLVERPSVKDLEPGQIETIKFDSHDVSKPNSCSHLTKIYPEKNLKNKPEIDEMKIRKLVEIIRNVFRMCLCGIDILLEEKTGRYAIIDINAFPGKDYHTDSSLL